MVLEYEGLTKDRRRFLALTGLTPKEFAEVHETARAVVTAIGVLGTQLKQATQIGG